MSSDALLMLVVTWTTVIAFTCYFFWKVLSVPPKPEPDSYTDNDDIKR